VALVALVVVVLVQVHLEPQHLVLPTQVPVVVVLVEVSQHRVTAVLV